ncbi:Oidioi.mRNA.OKI2018_I69.XSR.g14394.t1.cds [Oikopleura dioica]|uniref:Oidioi.mRNA.OKI2018_I69.XSR.g14394.t1.cds n=1 Tax=Oikopleura dioica TaxID=34765 RepID=A0ABN7SA61_OIKDI|nr:Oidioi.mRNA.OKI2018_I69.XSR.g14394.t1.cds [Oikopleura dioica]
MTTFSTGRCSNKNLSAKLLKRSVKKPRQKKDSNSLQLKSDQETIPNEIKNEHKERLIPCFSPNLFQCYASAPGSLFLCSLSILKSVFQKKINTNFRPVFVINSI